MAIRDYIVVCAAVVGIMSTGFAEWAEALWEKERMIACISNYEPSKDQSRLTDFSAGTIPTVAMGAKPVLVERYVYDPSRALVAGSAKE